MQLEYRVNETLPNVNIKLDTTKLRLRDDNMRSFGKVDDPALITKVEDALWNAGYRGRNGVRLEHGEYLRGDFEIVVQGTGLLVARMWERPVLATKKSTKTGWFRTGQK